MQAQMIAAERESYTCGHRISPIRVIVTGTGTEHHVLTSVQVVAPPVVRRANMGRPRDRGRGGMSSSEGVWEACRA
ncbi:hypothetical protein Sipo8835_18975 [Streptomyces ipomoeae]|uniref:Uncharacterized protein n=1 Tax=Streptomyces ipomoeae TaxID=103232 RepID=A0AAE8W435_9ACTN|nr:hypothetical protein Sipo8835_18975 [Streptomyces ipomoeae]